MVDRLALTLFNHRADLPAVLERIHHFLVEHDVEPRPRYVAQLAAEELIANSLTHGYPDGHPGEIRVEVDLDADRLRLTLRDDGIPFDPTRAPEPRRGATIEDATVGGRGLALVRRMSDGLDYRREGNRNRVAVDVRRPGKEIR